MLILHISLNKNDMNIKSPNQNLVRRHNECGKYLTTGHNAAASNDDRKQTHLICVVMFCVIIKYGRFVRKSRQGRVSLLSANICETEQQKQRTDKGQKFTLLQWNSHQRQRDRKTHLQWQMEVAPLQKREGNTAALDGNEGGIIKRLPGRIFCG